MSLECEAHVLEKIHKHTYSPTITHVTQPFNLVHSDVWDSASKFTSHGFVYYVLFVDNCTRISWVYFFKHKFVVFDVFVKFYKMFQIKFHTLIHILRVDNFGEHINLDMQQFFSTHGLIHQTTCLDTPQQNDIAKLKNQTLLDIT